MNAVEEIIKKSLGKTSTLFACCTHRGFNIDAMTNTMNLYGQRKHEITWFPMKGDALIDRARSRVASYFMQERDEDILFFVDDDESYKTEDVLKTIEHVRDGADICGGFVPLKKEQNVRGGTLDKNVMFFKDQSITFKADAKPEEIHLLGSGFMAIHRRVFQKLIDESNNFPKYHPNNLPLCHPTDLKFRPFFQPFPEDVGDKKVYLSEDWAFCWKARNLGFKVWLDPSIFIEHEGSYRWTMADALREPKRKIDADFAITIS